VEDKLFMEGQSFAVIGRWVDRAHIEQMIEAGATEVPARELSARLAEGTVDLLLTHRDIISSVDTWTSIGMPLWEALCHPRLRVVVEPSFVDDRLRNHLSPNPRGTRWDFFPHGMLVLTDLASLLGEEGGAEWIEGTLGLLAAVEDAAQALHQARSSRDDIIKGVPSLPRTSTKLGARPWGEHHLKLPLDEFKELHESAERWARERERERDAHGRDSEIAPIFDDFTAFGEKARQQRAAEIVAAVAKHGELGKRHFKALTPEEMSKQDAAMPPPIVRHATKCVRVCGVTTRRVVCALEDVNMQAKLRELRMVQQVGLGGLAAVLQDEERRLRVRLRLKGFRV